MRRAHLGPGPRGARGFTLVELLVVLAVIAALAAAALPLVRPDGGRWSGRALALDVAAELRRARALAISTGAAQAFAVEPESRRFGPGGRLVPPGLGIAVEGSPAAPARIEFYPDGSASGGRVAISGAGEALVVEVDWLTGRVGANRRP
jgi:general secretion pathway protein H